ncbi:MAG: PqqD family protein [Planctomycetes bacterium]|nr:PqqD family protein [Planctomycetota bacterium]
MAVSEGNRPRGREDLLYQEVTDGGVLFDPDGEKVYVLNASAAFVWNCCDGAHSSEEMLDELAASLGPGAPDRTTLRADIDKAIEHFRRNGLLADA